MQEVFNAAKVPITFEPLFFSEVNPSLSTPLETVAESIRKNGVCLKGITAYPDYSRTGELQNLNMKLRQTLDFYANVVHVQSLPGVKTRHNNLDLVVIREQTEGEYSALEHESVKGMVECLKIVTAKKSRRIAKFAFDYATKNKRKKVTCVHKANIMKLGDGLFLKCCEEMSLLYPRLEFKSMIIDNCTMQLITKPEQFDVIVVPNLYGSILDNLCSGLVGGAGVVAGASYSAKSAVFEPVTSHIFTVATAVVTFVYYILLQGARHTYSEAVGKNVANPTAMLLCSVLLLRHVNLTFYSEMISNAVRNVLKEGKIRTKDIGGHSSTHDFTGAVINKLQLTPPKTKG